MSGRKDSAQPALEHRLGYTFKDKAVLTRALTHRSAAPDTKGLQTYERLEFLGDRVLGLAVAEMLVAAFADDEEGMLAQRYNALVRGETCAAVARDLGLGGSLIIGPSEERSGGRRKVTLLSDVCEAVIGAIFIDGGFEQACRFVTRHWTERMMAVGKPRRDAKTALQEWSQGQGRAAPVYEQIAREGPDHAPVFTVRALVDGVDPAVGTGKSKREAEQDAAERLLIRAGIWTVGAPDHE